MAQKTLGGSQKDLSTAMTVVLDFAEFLEKNSKLNPVFEFEEQLPWKKEDIYHSILLVLKDSTNPKSKELVMNMGIFLSSFYPNQENYKNLMQVKDLIDFGVENKESLTTSNPEELKGFFKKLQEKLK